MTGCILCRVIALFTAPAPAAAPPPQYPGRWVNLHAACETNCLGLLFVDLRLRCGRVVERFWAPEYPGPWENVAGYRQLLPRGQRPEKVSP